ncbi:hypothetical protein [Chryseobacterium sp. GP-SGM7]|uniref:hypothetical protein n=1 Tax=Chryseobacterium sp. GP-SGM7 TaxID=3411323 RepID=UPI003B9285AE
MELTVKLEDNADVSLLKKILEEIKGIKSVEISENEIDDEKYRSLLNQVLEKSIEQADNGKTTKLTPELLNDIFK